MTAKIARQLTQYPRARARAVQVFAGSSAVVLTIILAMLSGRAPEQPHPIYAQQTLKEERAAPGARTWQASIVPARSQARTSRDAAATQGLLRPAFEPPKAKSSPSPAWLARAN